MMAKDPVCGMTVDDKAPLKSTYAGKNYVFCSASCKTKFDKEPGRYTPPVGGAAQQEKRT
jgi:Cu+-exporting ATPase